MLRPPLLVACWFAAGLFSATEPALAREWKLTGSMLEARVGHTATLLDNGRVLVVGGGSATSPLLAGVEVFDPARGDWSSAAPLATPRSGHTATFLRDGRVLVVGGMGGQPPRFSALASAEIYDPATDTWSATSSLSGKRSGHTATQLPDGSVLVAGGWSDPLALETAEIYDPAPGTWRPAAPLNVPRFWHSATPLADGTVLLVGGSYEGDLASTLSQTDIYHPVTDTWRAGPRANTSGVFHTATLTRAGDVLVTGGYSWSPTTYPRTEVFEPELRRWSSARDPAEPRESHTATTLAGGEVLVAGGLAYWKNGTYLVGIGMAEIFSPESGTWRAVGELNVPRHGHTATLLLDGRVLVVGGTELAWTGPSRFAYRETRLASAELYGDPAAIDWCKNHYILARPCPAPN